jgi:hypothetical protein
MRRLDNLIKKATSVASPEAQKGVHILEDDYCYSCKGKCKALNNDRSPKIVIDIPRPNKPITIVESGDYNNGFADAPNHVLISIVDGLECEVI